MNSSALLPLWQASEQLSLRLKALDPKGRYLLTSAEEKRSWEHSGAELMEGVSVNMATKTADIWHYAPKQED